MDPSQIDPSDDELSEIIDDHAQSDNDSDTGEGGFVEAGVPPPVSDGPNESVPNDESFGLEDFDQENTSTEVQSKVEDNVADHQFVDKKDDITSNGSGSVSQFREALSDLSRQVELDKLAFLHKQAVESGKPIASLEEIAGDINGSAPIFPKGDCDFYDTRATSRLEGWVVGLSFGANRRAKKFSK
ncbi:MAG: hypothetical protein CMI24_05210 [Opitutae bacterium]|nr:hypothetical protein [Opitutae bacterium]MEC8420678.1 hypothetical protein [Verrucomicrobiota bacterium]